MIYLFETTETEFNSLGLGSLPDCISCVVTEERNSSFELEMEYPITGINYSNLTLRRIILAKPNPYSRHQPFRIYQISRPIDGIVTVYAEHISYDLSGIVVKPFLDENGNQKPASTCVQAFQRIKEYSSTDNPFTFWTDKEVNAAMYLDEPASARSLLGGEEGSILDIYGTGDYEFDYYNVKFYLNRGIDNGTHITYSKNMTNLTFEEDSSKIYTHVFPYWTGKLYKQSDEYNYSDPEDVLITVDDFLVKCPGDFNFTRVMPLNCTSLILAEEADDIPTPEELRTYTEAYIKAYLSNEPVTKVKVSFVDLTRNVEDIPDVMKKLAEIRLCDIVHISYPELGVDSKAKCITTEYDVLTDRYKKIELGATQGGLADTVIDQEFKMNQGINAVYAAMPKKSELQKAIDSATKLVTGGLGGNVIIHSSSGDLTHPDEILILDTDSIETATNVWRWNKNGFAHSNRGYNGPYETAITMDGKIVGSSIAAGSIDAASIKANTITGDCLSIEYKNSLLSKDNVIAAINTSAEGVKIKGDKITLEGLTTINKQVEITEEGKLLFDGAIGRGMTCTDGIGIRSRIGRPYIDFYDAIDSTVDFNARIQHIATSEYDVEFFADSHKKNCRVATNEFVAFGFTHRSDYRHKTDIEDLDLEESKSFLMSLKPKKYSYNVPNEHSGTSHHGLIYQDVMATIPNVSWALATRHKNEIGNYGAIAYHELIPDMIKVIQDQERRIAELEAKLEDK